MSRPRHKLLLVHHFPLSKITGVSVIAGELLRILPAIASDIEVSYQHYENLNSESLIRKLDYHYRDRMVICGINLHIEVQWELSLALARWCRERRILLYNHVYDYWPHHRTNLSCLRDECQVQLLAASRSIQESLQREGFTSTYLVGGTQLPPFLRSEGPTQKIAGSIGRLVERKRFADVVRAFCDADLGQRAKLRLTLLPSQVFSAEEDTRQLNLIEEEIRRSGKQRSAIAVSTIPVIPPDYSRLSVYVCASSYEGLSMTPYEAAYCGCPPIVSDIPPHRQMAEALFSDSAARFLYPVGDTSSLAEYLSDEISTGIRAQILRASQANIRCLIERDYSIRTTANGMVRLCRAAYQPI